MQCEKYERRWFKISEFTEFCLETLLSVMYLYSLIHSVLFLPYGTKVVHLCLPPDPILLQCTLLPATWAVSSNSAILVCLQACWGLALWPFPWAFLVMYPSGLHVFTQLRRINFASALQGIEWTAIEYFNNAIICDLIEKVGAGSQKDQIHVIFSHRKRMRQLKSFLYVFKHAAIKMQNNKESASSTVTFFWSHFSKNKLVITL